MDEAGDRAKKKAELAHDRSCTDMLCCLIFFLWVLGMAGVSFWSFGEGNPAVLLTKFDSDGNICGNSTLQSATPSQGDRDFGEYKFLYFANLEDVVADATGNTKSK